MINIAILSAKGGTGKTTLSIALAHQYSIANPNREIVRAPIHTVTQAVAIRALADWPELTALARPVIGVLLGGNSGQYRLDAATAARLGRAVASLARRRLGLHTPRTSASLTPTIDCMWNRALKPLPMKPIPSRSLTVRPGN